MMATKPMRSSRLERLWRSDARAGGRLLAIPLRGAAGVFRCAAGARNLWWRWRSSSVGVPVISVGNLTVGGNAKTPFTLFLAARMQARGLRVAIVSRGYNRAHGALRAEIVADHAELLVDPERAGDEPAMMARRFTGPIAVARKRRDAIELLLARGPLDAVVLDDGFQHVRLRRDLDFVLINRERGLGNGWVLPAGPMREPLRALRRAAAVVITSSDAGLPPTLSARQLEQIERRRVLHASVRPSSLVVRDGSKWRETPPSLTGRRVLAVSGLADPAGFHAMLRELEADLVGVLDFPDHHSYTVADWQEIAAAARGVDLIVTTEKDLVKLDRFPFTRDSLYALRVDVTMVPSDAQALDDIIAATLRLPISGASASQEVPRDAC